MKNLSFGNNWRRELLLRREATLDDLEEVCDYVTLDESKLPTKIRAFCEARWGDYGFDYDTTTLLLWPVNDTTKPKELVARLNKDYPNCAKIVKKSVSDAHNVSLMWSSDDANSMEEEEPSNKDMLDENWDPLSF